MPLYTSVKGPYTYQTVGDVVIEDGIYTRTSRTSTETVYLTQNYTIADSFEVCVKFKADQTSQEVYLFSTDGYGGSIRILSNRLSGRVFPDWTYSSGLTISGASTIQIGTTYWAKYIQTKTKAELYLSTDGKHFTSEGSITYTRTLNHTFSGNVRFGSYSYQSDNYNFIGEIDLNESYIKVNDIPWFGRSQVRVRLNSGLAKYTKVGNPIIVDGVLTANTYDVTDYITIPSLPTNYNKIELVIKYSYQKPETNNTYLYYSYATSNSGWLQFDLSANGALECYISNNNNEVSAHPYMYPTNGAFSYNYAKVTMLGNQVYCSISTDGVNWIDGTAVEFSKASKYDLTLGKRVGKIAGNSIDLNESYIKLDDSYFWRGSDYYQNLNNYKIHQDTFSKYYTIVDGKLTWANPNIYLKGDGNSWIETGIYGTLNTEIKSKILDSTSSSLDLWGAGIGSDVPQTLTMYSYGGNNCRFGNKTTTSKLFSNVEPNVVIQNKTGVFVDSELKAVYNTTDDFTTKKTLGLMVVKGRSYYFTGRIYYFIINQDSTKIQHLVPVPKGLLIGNFVVPSNGMFDIVTQTFYGNSGTGEFEIGGIPYDYIIEGGKIIWCNPSISLENDPTTYASYIDTGIIPNNDITFRAAAELVSTESKDGCLFGCRSSVDTIKSNFVLWYNNYSEGYGAFNYGSAYVRNWQPGLSSPYQKYEYVYNGSNVILNGVTQTGGYDANKSVFSTSLPIYLFGYNNNGNLQSRTFRGKVFYFAISLSGKLVQYLVPVPKGILIGDKIAPSNCMFDLVTQTFFENQGTGEFIINGLSGDYIFVGDDVVWCNNSIYLSNDGSNRWIDTGYTADKNGYSYEADIQFIGTNRQLMGFGGNSKEYWGYTNSTSFELGRAEYITVTSANDRVKSKFTWSYTGTSTYTVNETLDINGTSVSTESVNYTAMNNVINNKKHYFIFKMNGYNGLYCNAKLFSHHIYNESDRLLQYLIPVTTNMQISGVTIPAPGMWDMVTKKYFPNKGTGSFNYGNDS